MSKLNYETPLLEHFILVTTKTRKVDQLGLDAGLLRSPAAVVPERLGQILGAGQQPLQVVPAKNIRSEKKNIWLQTEKYLHEVLHQRARVEPPPIDVGDTITSWIEKEFYRRKYIFWSQSLSFYIFPVLSNLIIVREDQSRFLWKMKRIWPFNLSNCFMLWKKLFAFSSERI